MPGHREFNMVQHVQDLMGTYATYQDIAATNHPYKVAFGEGNWTITLTDVTGTNTGPIQSPSGWRGPTHRRVNYEFMTAAYWEEGRIIKKHLWMDILTSQRQLGFMPSPIFVDGTQSLKLSPFTLPLTTNPKEDTPENNKDLHPKLKSGLNKRKLNAQNLQFAQNVTIFTAREDTPNSLTADQFTARFKKLQTSFSDLHISSMAIFGSGDWTASVAKLSGKPTGPLVVPEYVSDSPIPPTNADFDS